jgi:predicted alpha/beta-fold hydrolase
MSQITEMKSKLSDVYHSYMDLLKPVFNFWGKAFQEIEVQPKLDEIKPTDYNDNAELTQNVFERKRADYSIMGRNQKEVEHLLRICRFKEGNYSFYQQSFLWSPLTSFGALLLNQLSVNLQTLDRYEDIIVDFEDGGQSCMHIYKPESLIHLNNPMTPVVVFFPSLTHNQDGFKGLISHMTERKGWCVVVMNRRGLCQSLKTPPFWICGNDEDTRTMFKHLRSLPYFAKRPTFGIGWSMGAAQLTRYLGKYNTAEDREMDGLIAGANICGPLHSRDVQFVDEKLMTENMGGWMKNHYMKQEYLEFFEKYDLEEITRLELLSVEDQTAHKKLMAKYRAIYHKLSKSTNAYEIMFLHFHLHRNFTNQDILQHIQKAAQHLPYQTRLELEQKSLTQLIYENNEIVFNFFHDAHASHYAHKINIPFIAITSQDDPVINWSAKSKDSFLQSPQTLLISTKGGSHCLYSDEIFNVKRESWAESIIFLYFQDLLSQFIQEQKLF